MKLPVWLRSELDSAGTRLLDGDAERSDIVNGIADQIMARDPALARTIAREFTAKRLREWVKSKLHGFYASDGSSTEPGDQMELFGALPRLLETSPGRFAHVSTMTGPDWDAALRQAEVKAGNAGSHAKVIRIAYDQVRPLLRDDDTLTTADVAGKLAGASS